MDSIACTSRKCGQPIIEKSDPCRNKLSIASSSFPIYDQGDLLGRGANNGKLKRKQAQKFSAANYV